MASPVVELRSANAEFQHVETLKRNRNKRHSERQFFVEGVRNLNQALKSGWPILGLYYDRDRPLSAWAHDTFDLAPAARRYACAPKLMAELSDKDEPSELCAVVAMPEDDLARITVAPELCVVVLDRPQNPGNLGTILRTCDAFGVSGVIITGHAVDLYEPQVLRASMGSFFAVPVVRVGSPQDVAAWFADVRGRFSDFRIVGTSAQATQQLRSAARAGAKAVVFGNETEGMSRAWRELCDELVTIPMRGTASSLNITSAVAITLYELSVGL